MVSRAKERSSVHSRDTLAWSELKQKLAGHFTSEPPYTCIMQAESIPARQESPYGNAVLQWDL